MTAGGARAEVQISMETSANGKNRPMMMYFAADRLKMDMGSIAVIYRADTGTMFNIMKDEKKYMAFDAATQQRMGAMMSAMQEQMKQRMKSLPEAQRKQMEAAMAKAGVQDPKPDSGPKPSSAYVKTGQSKTVGAWSCQVFRKSLAGGVTIDSCFAPLSALGLTHEDLAAFKGLMERMRQTLPKSGDLNSLNLNEQTQEIGFEGFPVETITIAQGAPQMTSTVKSIQHVSLPADTFELPAGYAKQEMPGFGK
ncbi:MAG: DUF4412 domain-containing protein [Methylocystis sp.]